VEPARTPATLSYSGVVPPPTATAAAPPRKPGVIISAIAAIVAVGLLSGFAIKSQAQANADQEAAQLQAQDQAKVAADKALEKRKQVREKKAKAKQEAEAARQAEATQARETNTVYVAPAPGPGQSVDGEWSGEMAGGKYSFSMSLSDDDGQISGSMYQHSNATNESGTEELSGYREGNTIYLQGVSWDSSAPRKWGLDSIVIQVSGDGESISGTYGCDTCSTTYPITGSRMYDY